MDDDLTEHDDELEIRDHDNDDIVCPKIQCETNIDDQIIIYNDEQLHSAANGADYEEYYDHISYGVYSSYIMCYILITDSILKYI